MKITLLEPLHISEAALDLYRQKLIEAGHEFVAFDKVTTDPEELYQRAKDSEIVIVANHPLGAEVIERLDKTRYIAVAFTGTNHVGVDCAKSKGILVSNAAGYSNTAVAELVIGMTLDLLRHISHQNQTIRLGKDVPQALIGQEIKGKTVVIIGTGKIGVATARLFKAFGADLLGYDQVENPAAKEEGMVYGDLEEVLAKADIVSLHLPLNDRTQHLIDAKALSSMKETALLINCARGPIVDNHALAQALKSGQIAGAGIDVFDQEPPLAEDEALLGADTAVLSPHIGYYTHEAMQARAQIVFDNVFAFIEGKPTNLV